MDLPVPVPGDSAITRPAGRPRSADDTAEDLPQRYRAEPEGTVRTRLHAPWLWPRPEAGRGHRCTVQPWLKPRMGGTAPHAAGGGARRCVRAGDGDAAERLVQLPPPLLPVIRATPGGPRKVVTPVQYHSIEYGGPMKDVPTAEVARYRERRGEVGPTREDVTMLEILEAKREREGREKGLKEGLQAGRQEGREEGRLQERIANLEGLLERGHSWEAVEALTGIDEAGLRQLQEELDRLQGHNGSDGG